MRAPSEYCTDLFLHQVFPSYLSQIKNPRTKNEYWSYVAILCDYVKKDFLSLTKEDAVSFLSYMTSRYHDGTMSRKTILVRISCYSSLAKYIESSYPEVSFINPFRDLNRPQVDDSIPVNRIPTMEELDAIMSASKNNPPFYLILALAGRSALSASNILRLTIHNIIEENDHLYLRFEGKDLKTEDIVIRLPKDVKAILLDHVATLSSMDEKKHLFYNKHGHPMTLTNLDSGIRKIVKESGVEGSYTIKDIRSRAILEMRHAGADPVDIARYTGLSNLRVYSFVKASNLVGDCPADLVNYRLKKA